jgi:hypothetical protein
MRYPRTMLLLLCCLSSCGCGNDTPKAKDENVVTGKVYLGETMLNYGTVTFARGEERPFKSPIYPDGTYKVRLIPPGDYRVIVVTGQAPRPAAGGSSKGPPPSFKDIRIPEKYGDATTTDLKYMVQPGQHQYDIKLVPEETKQGKTPDKTSDEKEKAKAK